MNQSDVEAAHWYEKAAKQGDVRVQFRMGILYKEGRGVAQFMVAQVDYHICRRRWLRWCCSTSSRSTAQLGTARHGHNFENVSNWMAK